MTHLHSAARPPFPTMPHCQTLWYIPYAGHASLPRRCICLARCTDLRLILEYTLSRSSQHNQVHWHSVLLECSTLWAVSCKYKLRFFWRQRYIDYTGSQYKMVQPMLISLPAYTFTTWNRKDITGNPPGWCIYKHRVALRNLPLPQTA